ncbi:MAG TPA: hypothetical protein VL332_10580 [Candidatus Saccharimonadaceae bacterium]|jgi:hypothetical protein|nr:hypothetical protein [Candidatus Saccharimonadaceae bacterium]
MNARTAGTPACAPAPAVRRARAAALGAALGLGAALALAAPAFAQSPEPPPEAPEGVDYEAERGDSLHAGEVEVDFGAGRREGGALARRQRVRLSSEGLAAGVREGRGDPLAGGTFQWNALGGVLGAGKVVRRWGRGLVLGGGSQPWVRTALDADATSPPSRADGWWYTSAGARPIALLGGRFARRDLGGVGWGDERAGLAALGERRLRSRGGAQWSAWRGGDALSSELAMDRAGRWRAEAGAWRELPGARVALGARAGSDAFRPLADANRDGPSQALTAGLSAGPAALAARGYAALWRFREGQTGARASLEVEPRIPQHGALVIGFEEQHGTRRAPANTVVRTRGMRQGGWAEWRSGATGPSLTLREETWGRAAWARGRVRAVSTVRLEAPLVGAASIGVTHAVYRTESGESLYLPETEADRLVLRALTGDGERTRIECDVPVAHGEVRAAFELNLAEGRPTRAQWTVDWIRRARTR